MGARPTVRTNNWQRRLSAVSKDQPSSKRKLKFSIEPVRVTDHDQESVRRVLGRLSGRVPFPEESDASEAQAEGDTHSTGSTQSAGNTQSTGMTYKTGNTLLTGTTSVIGDTPPADDTHPEGITLET